MSEECIHGFDEGMCSVCISPPPGINARVWITAGGTHFHNSPNCSTLDFYQGVSAAEGNNVHDKKQVAWNSVQFERSACRNCTL